MRLERLRFHWVLTVALDASTGLTGTNERIVADRVRDRMSRFIGFLSTGDKTKFRPYNS